jgi:hypothetical protein
VCVLPCPSLARWCRTPTYMAVFSALLCKRTCAPRQQVVLWANKRSGNKGEKGAANALATASTLVCYQGSTSLLCLVKATRKIFETWDSTFLGASRLSCSVGLGLPLYDRYSCVLVPASWAQEGKCCCCCCCNLRHVALRCASVSTMAGSHVHHTKFQTYSIDSRDKTATLAPHRTAPHSLLRYTIAYMGCAYIVDILL